MSKKTSKKPAATKTPKTPKTKKAVAASSVETTVTAPAAPKEQRNGVTRPREGKCRMVWDLLDTLKAEGKEITFDVLRAGVGSEVSDATVRTQRQRWNKFNA